MSDITSAASTLQEIVETLGKIYTDPGQYVAQLTYLITQYGYDVNTQTVLATSYDPVFALARRTCLEAIYRAEPSVTWSSSTDAYNFRDTILPMFTAEITYAGQTNETDIFEYFNNAIAEISLDIQTRGYGLPDITTYTTKTSLPPCVIAQQLYGDGTRDDELIMRNAPIRPLFMDLTNEVLSR